MRIIVLPTLLTIVIDILVWGILQLSIARLSLEFKDKFLSNNRIFKVLKFEKDGEFYNRYFRIKLWKDKLPDGSKILMNSFSKQTFNAKDLDYLNKFLIEINRAEISHWLQILPAPLFFLFNVEWVGYFMIGYALIANIPFILAQRYNRARVIKIIENVK